MKFQNLLFLLVFWPIVFLTATAQTISPQTVRYLVTYNTTEAEFTVWVVPAYSTPNSNNPETEERGATAQVSLKVPREFAITSLVDVKGNWDKKAYKLTIPPTLLQAGVDADAAYYIIGKAPQETNYGAFKSGDPVPLFTFKGNGGDPAKVGVLAVNDPFVAFADTRMALNVRSSFYSRSGQKATTAARPMEQLTGSLDMNEVLKQKQKQLGLLTLIGKEDLSTMSLIAYPNPTAGTVNIKYFSQTDQKDIGLDLIDAQGVMHQTHLIPSKAGFNTAQLNIQALSAGVYFIRTKTLGRLITKKIVVQ